MLLPICQRGAIAAIDPEVAQLVPNLVTKKSLTVAASVTAPVIAAV
jgi:hypothetical protein